MDRDTYIKGLLLYCLNKIQGERSIYAIYHILKGKKSSQTIQDCRLFQLESLFNCYRSLKRMDLDNYIEQLIGSHEIETVHIEKKHYVLTPYGSQSLDRWETELGLPPHLNGAYYALYEDIFWKRLSLTFQVLSNLAHNCKHYIPITRDDQILNFAKKWLKQQTSISSTIAYLYQELYDMLNHLDDLQAAIFVHKLTGYKKIGKTVFQLSEALHINSFYGQLSFVSTLHYLLGTILKNKQAYPVLFSLIADLAKGTSFTDSTSKTYTLLQKGYSIEEIAVIRELKPNTIEDHIVEIALIDKTFPVWSFISPELEEKIKNSVEQLQTKKLKLLKEKHPEASYFQIRLVLARQGRTINEA
ncbi:helix-turn-helix domain-containing protein [Bacillus litorisediminis]|uniref:helix-turn-helix domain-containing protein n=1 Tax=Bacillus litorisediminis TaxID=2922713 RepID=UPI001FAFF778|nr:helix-turn-helix domain-containing protein [Bacillus litorisediminis]